MSDDFISLIVAICFEIVALEVALFSNADDPLDVVVQFCIGRFLISFLRESLLLAAVVVGLVQVPVEQVQLRVFRRVVLWTLGPRICVVFGIEFKTDVDFTVVLSVVV